MHISRCPEKEKPPHSVGQETPGHDGPRLAVGQALPDADALRRLGLFRPLGHRGIGGGILLDVGQFHRIDALALLRGIVHIHPNAHPNKTYGTHQEEGHLPSPASGQQRYDERSEQGANLCPAVEHAGGKPTVFFRKVFRRDFNGCREVSRLPDGQYATGSQKEPDTDRPYAVRHRLQRGQVLPRPLEARQPLAAQQSVGGNPTEGMEACPGRPQPDGPQIAAPRTHLVDKLADDQHGDGVHDGKAARDKPVVRVVPPEFRRNKIFPRQRQNLTVHVVDGRSQEQHGTYDPTVTGHSCKCLI